MKLKEMRGFFRTQRPFILCFLALQGAMIFVLYLYQQNMEAFVTGFFLSLLILILILMYQWHQYQKALRALSRHQYDPASFPAEAFLYVDALKDLQDQGRKDKEQARKDSRELLDYFALWSHQAKLPISVLQLLCLQEPIDTKALSIQMKRLEKYVEMATAFVRLESASDYKIKKQPLDAIIKPAIRNFAAEFIHKKLSLQYEGTDLEVLSDSKWLQFVIEQILSNSIRYTPSYGTITIYTRGSMLFIVDTGCGIDPADLPRIFEQGYSGFNGHNENSSSGIGLYLCKKILHQLSHEIHIESRPDVGTMVAIDLRKGRIVSE